MTLEALAHILQQDQLPAISPGKPLTITAEGRSMEVVITSDPAGIRTQNPIIPLDYVKTMPEKVLAWVQSKLGLNKTVFARNCNLQKIPRGIAEDFLKHYHFMSFTQSAYNYGLFYREELVAVASFSKGRKMDRLPEDRRSFELIRFCCKSGITVTGGLTRLVKNFAIEKNAGDIMTYVDKQLSDGRSFMRAGFKKLGESQPVAFLIDKNNFERQYYTGGDFDQKRFYLAHNLGNLKLIYTLHEPA
jgi:hypothetical protein